MSKFWQYLEDDNLKYLDQSVLFLNSEFPSSLGELFWSTDYFKWKLTNINPAGAGFMSIALANESIVGTTTLTLKRILINGKEILGGEIGDCYSSISIRRKGVPLKISNFDTNPEAYINKSVFGRLAHETRLRAEKIGVSFIYGTPNSNAYPGWINNLGYTQVQNINICNYSRPTPYYASSEFFFLRPFESVLKLFDDTIVDLNRKFINFFHSKSFYFEPPSIDEINELWIKCLPKKGFSLIRDGNYWYHRYYERPNVEYDTFSIKDKSGLFAILITRKYSRPDGKICIALVEWMGKGNIFSTSLLNEIIFYYRNYKISFYHLFLSQNLQRISKLRSKLFFPGSRVPLIQVNTIEDFDHSIFKESIFYIGSTDAI